MTYLRDRYIISGIGTVRNAKSLSQMSMDGTNYALQSPWYLRSSTAAWNTPKLNVSVHNIKRSFWGRVCCATKLVCFTRGIFMFLFLQHIGSTKSMVHCSGTSVTVLHQLISVQSFAHWKVYIKVAKTDLFFFSLWPTSKSNRLSKNLNCIVGTWFYALDFKCACCAQKNASLSRLWRGEV